MTDHVRPQPADNAGVHFPPPLLYVTFFALGLLLHWPAPLNVLPLVPARLAALLLLLLSLALLLSANVLFRRAGTSLVPVRPSTALVVRGPYRVTRNPMYVGLLCLYLAVALWFGIVWALILSPLLI